MARFFIESANLEDLRELLPTRVIEGIATDPSLLARQEKADFWEHINRIIDLCRDNQLTIPLSVHVFADTNEEATAQARSFVEHFGFYEPIMVGIPIRFQQVGAMAALKTS